MSIGTGLGVLGKGILAFMAAMVTIAAMSPLLFVSIQRIATGFVQLLITLTGLIADLIIGMAMALLERVPPLLERLVQLVVNGIISLIMGVLNAINENKDKIKEGIVGIIQLIAETIVESTLVIGQAVTDLILGIMQIIDANQMKFMITAMSLIMNFMLGLKMMVLPLINLAAQIMLDFINGLADSIRTNTPLLLDAVVNLAAAFWDGLLEYLGFSNGESESSKGLALDFLSSFITGLAEGAAEVVNKIIEVAQQIWQGFKDFFGISSPSDVAKEGAEEINAGLKQGLENSSDGPMNAALDVGKKILKSITGWFGGGEAEEAGESVANGLATSITNNTNAPVEAVNTMNSEMINTLDTNGPMLEEKGAEIPDQFATGILSNVEAPQEAIKTMLGLGDENPDGGLNFEEYGANLTDSFATGILSGSNQPTLAMDETLLGIQTSITNKTPEFEISGQETIESFTKGVSNKQQLSNLLGEIDNLMDSMVETIKNRQKDFVNQGKVIIDSIIEGIRNPTYRAKLTKEVEELVLVMIRDMRSYVEGPKARAQLINLGYNMGMGIVNGLISSTPNLASTGASLADTLIQYIKSQLEQNSPSKVGIRIGKDFGTSIGMGLEDSTSNVTNSAHVLTDNLIDKTRSIIQKMAEVLDDELDLQPVISPVLDLSQVTGQSEVLKNLLANDRAAGILASAMFVNQRHGFNNQNGGDETPATISVVNEFNLNGVTIREEADIDRVAEQLYRKQESAMRGRGFRPGFI